MAVTKLIPEQPKPKPAPTKPRTQGSIKTEKARQLARMFHAKRRLDTLIATEPLFTADQLEELAWILFDAADVQRAKDE